MIEHGGPADELFVERAREVRPDFAPDDDERARVRELAAARLLTLDVADIAGGLDRRFRLLAAGSRTSTRHRSLGAAIEWSYGLLDADLRRVFADLSVFVGPFDVDAVAAVAELDPPVALDALDALTERSLVTRAGGGRFTMLETLRAFGMERLEADGRQQEFSRRHARHFAEWTVAHDRRLAGPGHSRLAPIEVALPDLAAALAWLLASALAAWQHRDRPHHFLTKMGRAERNPSASEPGEAAARAGCLRLRGRLRSVFAKPRFGCDRPIHERSGTPAIRTS